jgi:SAM-dependent methyltransferase
MVSAGSCGAAAEWTWDVDWAEYWNQETSLYVNERHRRLHYEQVTRDIIAHVPRSDIRLIDYGCGDTPAARDLADACGHLLLCDAAPRVRDELAARYAGVCKISILTPEQFQALPAASIGMVVVNSVVQYLSRSEFAALLQGARHKLEPGGVLLLADIVPPHVSPWRDALELLKFAASGGFLLPAVVGLARSYVSPYRKIRQRSGFLQFEAAELLALLRQHGFNAQRQPRNIGHNPERMTFRAIAR